MSKKNKETRQPEEQADLAAVEALSDLDPKVEAPAETPAEEAVSGESELELTRKALAEEHDKYLRLAAEYDNFRKRSIKEKDARYTDAKADTVGKFLPVYDDLERALSNETSDEAYKKGVELIMTELRKIMSGLGVEEFGTVGDPFDPNAHNAVMHIENEELGENVIAQVFQRGFRMGEKVIRHAVVQVAN
ncbi:MAG: nucleotide exchange factor GrpE [Oscillospiraceae bacterium]|nr:nucleotide exchange factor GrpE [Oscillospiraceae bacterium]